MEQRWVDYYSVLDVGQQDERAAIEARYRSLCKTYHPDINHEAEAETRMKEINLAWEVLRDEARRLAFHREWMQRQHMPRAAMTQNAPRYSPPKRPAPAPEPIDPQARLAREAVERYLRHINKGEVSEAFALLSERDRRNIGEDGFLRWQRAVASTYRIDRFAIMSCKMYEHCPLSGYDGPARRFLIEIDEREVRTGKTTRYRQVKFAVREKDDWHIYLGYRDIDNVVEGLAAARGGVSEMHRRMTDPLTGMPNRQGFLDKCKPEAYRISRYERSGMLCILEMHHHLSYLTQELYRQVILQASFSVRATLRLIDVAGTAGDGKFYILLAETDTDSGRRAIMRIARRMEQDILACLDLQVGFHKRLVPLKSEAVEKALEACAKTKRLEDARD